MIFNFGGNSGGNKSNMYFDQDDGGIYVIKKDGTPHLFAYAGVNAFDINDLTLISPDDWELECTGGAVATISSNPFLLNITSSEDNTGKVVATSKSLSLGAFNKLTAIGAIKGYRGSGGHGFALINEKTGNADYSYTCTKQASEGVDLNLSETISLDATATYKIQITLYGYKGWYPSYFKFDTFRLYKE